jgi:hypothetical protein
MRTREAVRSYGTAGSTSFVCEDEYFDRNAGSWLSQLGRVLDVL